jgi:hypothetical protein
MTGWERDLRDLIATPGLETNTRVMFVIAGILTSIHERLVEIRDNQRPPSGGEERKS